MMTSILRFFPIALLALAGVVPAAFGQAVNSINFNYLYNLQSEVEMRLTPVVRGDSINLFFQIIANNPNNTRYIVHWEKRDSYAQRQGATLAEGDTLTLSNGWTTGNLKFTKPEKPWVLLARVTNPANGKKWYFIRQIESHYPVNGFITLAGVPQWLPFHQEMIAGAADCSAAMRVLDLALDDKDRNAVAVVGALLGRCQFHLSAAGQLVEGGKPLAQ